MPISQQIAHMRAAFGENSLTAVPVWGGGSFMAGACQKAGRASNPYGQHIQAQQILIAHICGDFENHADADVFTRIARL